MSDFHHSPRWRALRQQAKRRDGFKCTECGSRAFLEVHHKQPVETHPELAFELGNLVTLCRSCHLRATLLQRGVSEERLKWRAAVKNLCRA